MKDTLLESNLGQNIKYNHRKQKTITEHQKIIIKINLMVHYTSQLF